MSCLFDALSKNMKISSQQLRKRICKYLQNNPLLAHNIAANKWVKWEFGVSLGKYIARMSAPSTWGGGLEILAFAKLFKINVN